MTRQWLRDFARFLGILWSGAWPVLASMAAWAVILAVSTVLFAAVIWLDGCGVALVEPAAERVGAGQGCEDCPPCDIARPRPGTLIQMTPVLPYDDNALWDNFTTVTLVSGANTNGRSYVLELRWNTPAAPITGTMLQMVGGANQGWVREAYTYGRAFQDSLAALGR